MALQQHLKTRLTLGLTSSLSLATSHYLPTQAIVDILDEHESKGPRSVSRTGIRNCSVEIADKSFEPDYLSSCRRRSLANLLTDLDLDGLDALASILAIQG